MSVNIAAAIQSQMLQTLLQALQSADQPLKAGQIIDAKFINWVEPGPAKPANTQGQAAPDSNVRSVPKASAHIEISGRPTTLMIAATADRQAHLQSGATLTLQVDTPAEDGNPAQLRLLSITPPGATSTAAVSTANPETDGASSLIRNPLQTAEALRAAAGPVVGAALSRQNGLAPLFADLAALVRSPQPMPASVAMAASNTLAHQTALQQMADDPNALKAGVRSSGLFHEALLATKGPSEAAHDLKSALSHLRQVLRDALGHSLPISEQVAKPAKPDARPASVTVESPASARPQAPSREGLPAPQGVALPSIDGRIDTLQVMMTKVLDRTEAALDRLTISQFASLPHASASEQGTAINRWFTELPVTVDGRAAVLPLEIEEDRGGHAASAAQAKLWRIRFALDVEPMGPVHALVTMQGRSIGVTVWAERDATSKLVRDHAPDLKAALLDSDFDNPQIEVLAGQPIKRKAHAGHYLDRRS